MPRRTARSEAGLYLDAAVKAAELAVASQQVVAARLAMGSAALGSPSVKANSEALLMVSEKTAAFTQAGIAAGDGVAALAARNAAYLATEAAAAGAAMTSPFAAVELAGRAFDHWSAMTRLGLEMQAAAMRPIHKTATANARRLK